MDYIFTTLGNLVHQTAFFNLTADGGKFYHDICGMLFPVSGHWTRL